MSLVTIALDRYFAVLNKSKSKLIQSKLFCILGFLAIWIFSGTISSPMLFSYKIEEVVIVPDDNHLGFYRAKLCMTDPVSVTMENLPSIFILPLPDRSRSLLLRRLHIHFLAYIWGLRMA